MPTPKLQLQNISKKTKIPYDILEEVYKKGSKQMKSVSSVSPNTNAKKKVDFFIKNGCSFKLYPTLVNKAIRQMSQNDVKMWCKKQIKN
jgi:hypothetical protein